MTRECVNRKKIGFLIQSRQHYAKLTQIRDALKEDYDTHYLLEKKFPWSGIADNQATRFLPDYTSDDRHINILNQKAGTTANNRNIHDFISEKKELFNTWAKKALLEKQQEKNARLFWKKPFAMFYDFFLSCHYMKTRTMQCVRYKSQLKMIERYILTERPDVFFIAEANVEFFSEAFISRCHQAGIPVIIAPYTFCSPAEPALYYQQKPLHKARAYHKYFIDKNWFYHFAGRNFLRLPLINILAMQSFKLCPPMPWVQESSHADAILVESMAMKHHYLKLGIPAHQLALIGDIVQDKLHSAYSQRDTLRHTISHELGFNDIREIAVFGVYPDCSPQNGTPEGFSDYFESVEYIARQLARSDRFNVILCLHPSLTAEIFSSIETDRIRICTRPTTELIAISDLYVACISATIRWAIALGIPVINYDVFRFRYNDYANVPGVENVGTRADFESILKKMIDDPERLSQLKQRQNAVSEEWGVIDGQFIPRLKNLVENLTNTAHKKENAA